MRPPHRFSQRVANALKQLGTMRIWLVVAVCVMTLAVLLSGSRSGLIGLMSRLRASARLLTRGRGTLAVRRWVILQFALLALVVLSFANFDALLRRLDESMTRAQAGRGRIAIWRDAIRLIGDFPLTGTGAGTFGNAISVYQTAEPGYAIDQAHNHYLQLMAEGGAWLLLPAALAAGLFLRAGEPQSQTGSVVELSHQGRRMRRHRGRAGAEHLGDRADDAGERAAVRRACGHRDLARVPSRDVASAGPRERASSTRLTMLRIGFDLDGVVADFRTAFLDAAAKLLGQRRHSPAVGADARFRRRLCRRRQARLAA